MTDLEETALRHEDTNSTDRTSEDIAAPTENDIEESNDDMGDNEKGLEGETEVPNSESVSGHNEADANNETENNVELTDADHVNDGTEANTGTHASVLDEKPQDSNGQRPEESEAEGLLFEGDAEANSESKDSKEDDHSASGSLGSLSVDSNDSNSDLRAARGAAATAAANAASAALAAAAAEDSKKKQKQAKNAKKKNIASKTTTVTVNAKGKAKGKNKGKGKGAKVNAANNVSGNNYGSFDASVVTAGSSSLVNGGNVGTVGNLGNASNQDDALMLTQVLSRANAELSLKTQRECQIAQTVAFQISEAYQQRMSNLNNQLVQLQQVNLQHQIQAQQQGGQISNPHYMNMNMNMSAHNINVHPHGAHAHGSSSVQNGHPMSAHSSFISGMNQVQLNSSLNGFGHHTNNLSNGAAIVGATPAKRKNNGAGSGSRKSKKHGNDSPTYGSNVKLGLGYMDMGSSSALSVTDSANGSARWTPEQDEALRQAVKKYDGRNWKAIADEVEGRDHVQCLQRWKKVLRPGLVKGHWSAEEDKLLLQLIQDEKMHSWAMVAEQIKGRTAKQCRERWSLNLDPGINRSPWTAEEDALLIQLHERMGGKWSEIKQQFDGRTENAVKTRFKSLERAKAREWTKDQDCKLIQLRMKYGKNWTAIKREMPGRSRNAIKVRCKTLEYDNGSIKMENIGQVVDGGIDS